MSKLDQLRAMREVRHGLRGRQIASVVVPQRRTALLPQGSVPGGVAPTPRKTKVGRPRIEDKDKTLKATAPWKKAGMSRRTWFRRRAERVK